MLKQANTTGVDHDKICLKSDIICFKTFLEFGHEIAIPYIIRLKFKIYSYKLFMRLKFKIYSNKIFSQEINRIYYPLLP